MGEGVSRIWKVLKQVRLHVMNDFLSIRIVPNAYDELQKHQQKPNETDEGR